MTHPNDPAFESMEARLDRLEAELGRSRREATLWRRAGGAILALGAIAVFTGQGAPDELVSAKRFTLVDGAGTTRAALQLEAGQPRFTLYDLANKARLDFSTTDQGATRVALQDGAGQGRLVLWTTPDGAPNITMQDAQGKPRCAIALTNDGPGFYFQDDKGVPLLSLGAAKSIPTITLRDVKNVIRALLALEDKDKFGSLRFYDENGKKTEVVEGE